MPKSMSTRALDEAMASPDAPQVIDVRRQPAFDASETMITGASWRNPDQIDIWAPELDRSRTAVVYCVHGHQVSQGCAVRLEEAGFRAAYLEGGFEKWAVEERSAAPKPTREPG